MRNVLFLLAIITLFVACSEDNSLNNNQKIWIDGYTVQFPNSYKKESAQLKFLFFPENKGKKYNVKSIPSHTKEWYEYIKLPDDTTYRMLVDENCIKLTDGTKVKAINYFLSTKKKTKEIEMPIGRYFVVAIRGDNDIYRNKYSCKYYEVISRYNPITLTATIPGDLTHYGMVPWINWEDKPYDF